MNTTCQPLATRRPILPLPSVVLAMALTLGSAFLPLPASAADAPLTPSSDPWVGRVVALDPGHGGMEGASRMVSDGRGGTKPCQQSGTATVSGYPEHSFTWDVVRRTTKLLRAHGVIVKLTRKNDKPGKALCVNKRGTFAQRVGAELMVSVHGDGNDNTAVKGFFALVSSPPLNTAQGKPSRDLAKRLMRQLKKEGFTQNAAFSGGFYPHSGVAGLNFSTVPTVMMELGEMRNPAEAKVMATAKGRQRYARALSRGILNYLKAHPQHQRSRQ